jgi:hypothetical protein
MDGGTVYVEDGDLRGGALVEEELGLMGSGDQGTEVCVEVGCLEA